MKKHTVHIILAVVIIALAVAIGYLYFTDKNKSTVENPVETTEPVETSAPESTVEDTTPITDADRGASDGEVVNQIDWESINPATHSTYDKETNKVTIDDTMWNYMYEHCPAFDLKPLESTKSLLSIYLVDYYGGRFGDDEWLKFAITGDNTVLNLAITDAELAIMSDQLIDEFLQTEEGKETQKELEETLGTQEERQEDKYKFMADQLGITVDELKDLLGITDGGAGNGGGGSSPVANPDTQQPNANENNFVTPETDNPDNGNNGGGNGGGTTMTPGGVNEAGDGGDIITDITLNP